MHEHLREHISFAQRQWTVGVRSGRPVQCIQEPESSVRRPFLGPNANSCPADKVASLSKADLSFRLLSLFGTMQDGVGRGGWSVYYGGGCVTGPNSIWQGHSSSVWEPMVSIQMKPLRNVYEN